jgi:hypothetical protein
MCLVNAIPVVQFQGVSSLERWKINNKFSLKLKNVSIDILTFSSKFTEQQEVKCFLCGKERHTLQKENLNELWLNVIWHWSQTSGDSLEFLVQLCQRLLAQRKLTCVFARGKQMYIKHQSMFVLSRACKGLAMGQSTYPRNAINSQCHKSIMNWSKVPYSFRLKKREVS